MDKWLEEFYEELERKLTNYTRPADYKERFIKVSKRQYNPVENQYEGRTKGKRYE